MDAPTVDTHPHSVDTHAHTHPHTHPHAHTHPAHTPRHFLPLKRSLQDTLASSLDAPANLKASASLAETTPPAAAASEGEGCSIPDSTLTSSGDLVEVGGLGGEVGALSAAPSPSSLITASWYTPSTPEKPPLSQNAATPALTRTSNSNAATPALKTTSNGDSRSAIQSSFSFGGSIHASDATPTSQHPHDALNPTPTTQHTTPYTGLRGRKSVEGKGKVEGVPEGASWDPERALASMRHEFGEHGGVNMSIENSSTFTVMRPETMTKIFKGEMGPEDDAFVYSRHYNPTVMHLGRQLAALEGTESGYCTASGMAAISAALMQLTSHGDNIVASNRLYGGSYALLAHFLPKKCGITTTFVDITDTSAVESAIRSSPATKVLFFESISNPTLVVADIPHLADVAHRLGAKVVVDNTFAPMLMTPARLGADVVVHSLSKFISGGSDIIAGCVCGSTKMVSSMMDLTDGPLMILGATMNPQVAFHISTRLPHLALRMREHSTRALAIALQLQQAGLTVVYPGLENHPQHELLKGMLNAGHGFGGMLSVDFGSSARAYEFMDHMQNGSAFGYMAVSLGYHDTLMSCSGASTSSEMGSEELEAVGISPGLVRISVGFSGALEQRQHQLHSSLVSLGYADEAGLGTGLRDAPTVTTL